MRVVIRVDAGGPHGFGHAARCKALAEGLDARGVLVVFVTATPALAPLVAPFPCLPLGELLLKPHDTIIIDTKAGVRAETPLLTVARQVLGSKVVCMDDPQATPGLCDLLVAPVAHWSPATVEGLHAAFGERFLYGWRYVMLPREVQKRPPLPYAGRKPQIVVCAGGTDPEGALPQIYAWTKSLALPPLRRHAPELVFAAPAGADLATYPLGGRAMATCVTHFRRALLREAALVVGFLGLTVYEALYYRTPMLCFARTPDEVESGWHLSAALGLNPAVVPLETLSGCHPGGLLLMMTVAWEQQEVTRAKSQSCVGLIDGHGVARVADAILTLGDP